MGETWQSQRCHTLGTLCYFERHCVGTFPVWESLSTAVARACRCMAALAARLAPARVTARTAVARACSRLSLCVPAAAPSPPGTGVVWCRWDQQCVRQLRGLRSQLPALRVCVSVNNPFSRYETDPLRRLDYAHSKVLHGFTFSKGYIAFRSTSYGRKVKH